MLDPFDILTRDRDNFVWVASAASRQAASELIRSLKVAKPESYVVFDQRSQAVVDPPNPSPVSESNLFDD